MCWDRPHWDVTSRCHLHALLESLSMALPVGPNGPKGASVLSRDPFPRGEGWEGTGPSRAKHRTSFLFTGTAGEGALKVFSALDPRDIVQHAGQPLATAVPRKPVNEKADHRRGGQSSEWRGAPSRFDALVWWSPSVLRCGV